MLCFSWLILIHICKQQDRRTVLRGTILSEKMRLIHPGNGREARSCRDRFQKTIVYCEKQEGWCMSRVHVGEHDALLVRRPARFFKRALRTAAVEGLEILAIYTHKFQLLFVLHAEREE